MATQEGSEDFDLAGVNASDGDDDLDWASLDESEQQSASASKAPAAFTPASGAIPFHDSTAQAAPPSTGASTSAQGRTAPRPSSAAVTSTQSPSATAAVGAVRSPLPTISPAAGPAAAAAASPARPAGTAGLPPPPARPAAGSTPSPAAPSPQSRTSPAAAAATPPAPRYAARPLSASPAAAAGTASPAPGTSPAAARPQQAHSAAPQPMQDAVAPRPRAALQPREHAGASQQSATAAPATAAGQHAAAAPRDAGEVQPAEAASSHSPASHKPVQDDAASATTEAANTSSSSSGSHQQRAGGGWGWGLGGLSSKLQQVALGAAKDLQELTASVQQAVAEVVAADDVSEVDKLSAYQSHPTRPPAVSAGASTAPPAAMAASRDSQGQLPTIHEPDTGEEGPSAHGTPTAADAEEQRRLEVLNRLQGHDTQLESGLKVIDDQVDLLAASAAKAFGSLWGGFSNVAKQGWTVGQAITTKVEAAAKEVAKELAVGLEEGAAAVAPVTSLAERLAATAEKGLESVGRVGASLLEPAASSSSQQHHGSTPSDWASTFDSCFELYGGSQAAEELEQLSSECAGICNRARARLQQQHREQIDRTLAKLVPAFDLHSQQQQDPAADGSSLAQQQQQQQQVELSEAMQDGLEHMYLPVAALCNKGKHKVQQVQQEAESVAAGAVAEDSAAAAAAHTGSDAAEAGQAEIQPEAAPADETTRDNSSKVAQVADSSSSSKVEALLSQLLSSLRSAAVKSLAEVSAGQLMMLLALGRSVAAVPRYGKPLDDGLEWPSEPDQVAAVMKQQVQLMLDDIQQLAGTFKATAPQLISILQAACSKVATAAGVGSVVGQFLACDVAQKQASLVVEEVAVDCDTAVRHLTDGFGKLLYVVLLSSLHQAGKAAAAEGGATAVTPELQATT